MNVPEISSASTSNSKLTLLPSPSQLFSLILKAKEPPSVPIPAPALISPVGFSSTSIFMIFKFSADPSFTEVSTLRKMFLDFISAIDFCRPKLVKGSPSSSSSSPRITLSLVMLFPVIFILSTRIFLPSKTLICTAIPLLKNFTAFR